MTAILLLTHQEQAVPSGYVYSLSSLMPSEELALSYSACKFSSLIYSEEEIVVSDVLLICDVVDNLGAINVVDSN